MESIEADGTFRQLPVDELANGEVEATAPKGQPHRPTHRLEDGVPEPGDSTGGRLSCIRLRKKGAGWGVGQTRTTEVDAVPTVSHVPNVPHLRQMMG